jgi:hypothetical protein
MDQLENLLKVLDKIQGLSAVALVCFTCIVVGYALKFVKSFPNNAIPLVVIMWGAVAMLFLADPRPTTMSPRIWTARNFSVGLLIGALAWGIHYWALSYLETWIKGLLPRAKPVDTPPEQDKTPEKTETKP